MALPLKDQVNSLWKLEKVRYIVHNFPECQLNLPFFNPYLKSNKTLYTYRLLMRAFRHNCDEENNRFINDVISELQSFKKRLYEELESQAEKIEKVLPIFHVMIHLFTFFKFTDREAVRQLAQEAHELRMLPIPYGLLPHEMIEIVDNERVIPGLTKIFKLAEDFPYLDNYSLTKERDKYEIIH